jgi:uncharacterized protein (DUF362 family)/NAD-dependent dihydropyrimidine dehydrogenase PreA subunit
MAFDSARVYAVRCPDYDQADQKVSELLDQMGGLGRFVSSGQHVALKVNLLRAAEPDEAVCTHPALVEAVGRRVRDLGASARIVDSPGAGYRYNRKVMTKVYARSGMEAAARAAGVELNWDLTVEPVSVPDGVVVKRIEAVKPILDADVVLNLCKLKTHLFMYVTAAIKNNFGVIGGMHKPGYHAKLQDTDRFAGMLLDLAGLVNPRLSIMDAVVAMEGNGPGSGDPRPVGLLLASENPLALDVVAGEIVGIAPADNPVLRQAARRDLSPARIEDVELIGLEKDELAIPGFKLPPKMYTGTGLGGPELNFFQTILSPLFKTGLSVQPRVNNKKCTGCASCFQACPVGAITMTRDEKARIDDQVCIRCYCCHEMCEYGAVNLKRSLLHRLVNPS